MFTTIGIYSIRLLFSGGRQRPFGARETPKQINHIGADWDHAVKEHRD